MTKIVGVRFKTAGKLYYFDPLDIEIKRGDSVIVETSRGIEYGEAVFGIKEVEDSTIVKPLKGVLRLATPEDKALYKSNKEKEKEAFAICREKIAKHGLDMKLIEVEYTFDGNKILFYFTADGRVDFRDLVKDLAAVFKTRIELRQIGVRDESKTMGSIGVCGRNLCCSQFLGEFVPVSIKMAKEQGLSLNPSKISGACGRLMCCLKYEQDTYEELIAQSPHSGAEVSTPDGKGTVMYVELLRGRVKVRFDKDESFTVKDYDVKDVRIYDPELPEVFERETPEKVLTESLGSQAADEEKQTKPKSNVRRKTRKKQNDGDDKRPQRPVPGRGVGPAKLPKTSGKNEGKDKNDNAEAKAEAHSEGKEIKGNRRYKNNRKKSHAPRPKDVDFEQ